MAEPTMLITSEYVLAGKAYQVLSSMSEQDNHKLLERGSEKMLWLKQMESEL